MIRIERLRKTYAAFALEIERLELRTGEYFVVLGPSGAGKTVLLSCLAGLERPDHGRIFFDALEVTDLPPERRSVGWVSQGNTLFPHLTVAQNVRFGRRYYRGDGNQFEGRFERLVELLELGPLLDRAPVDLSGGEAQRAMLARALVIGPRVLLLDEPLRGLDPTTQELLRDELAAIHRELGTTTLHITHDHVEARALADRIAVLRAGRVEQVGPADEVFEQPASCFVARFTGAENLFRLSPAPAKGPHEDALDVLDREYLPTSAVPENATHVAVRAEHVEVRSGGDTPAKKPDDPLRLEGTIASITRHGGWMRVSVRCDTTRWIARVHPREVARHRLSTGRKAYIFVRADHFSFIRESAGGGKAGSKS